MARLLLAHSISLYCSIYCYYFYCLLPFSPLLIPSFFLSEFVASFHLCFLSLTRSSFSHTSLCFLPFLNLVTVFPLAAYSFSHTLLLLLSIPTFVTISCPFSAHTIFSHKHSCISPFINVSPECFLLQLPSIAIICIISFTFPFYIHLLSSYTTFFYLLLYSSIFPYFSCLFFLVNTSIGSLSFLSLI